MTSKYLNHSYCQLTIFLYFFIFPATPVNILEALELSESIEGVTLAAGICTHRQGIEETDIAFRLENRTHFSAPTKQLFPGEFINVMIIPITQKEGWQELAECILSSVS